MFFDASHLEMRARAGTIRPNEIVNKAQDSVNGARQSRSAFNLYRKTKVGFAKFSDFHDVEHNELRFAFVILNSRCIAQPSCVTLWCEHQCELTIIVSLHTVAPTFILTSCAFLVFEWLIVLVQLSYNHAHLYSMFKQSTTSQLFPTQPNPTQPNPTNTALYGSAEISQTTGPIGDLYAGRPVCYIWNGYSLDGWSHVDCSRPTSRITTSTGAIWTAVAGTVIAGNSWSLCMRQSHYGNDDSVAGHQWLCRWLLINS
uniref:Uncharacterized protein n=1 Tax=Strigamia maritima TaxID=126957 RepID=T1ILB8_STRMM